MSVKRVLIGALVLAACSLPAVSGAAMTASVPKAKLRGSVCKTARDPATREVAIAAVMRPLPHTVKMALRIELLERKQRTGPTRSLRYGDLGSWISPANKTLGQRAGDIWIVSHPVVQLAIAPAYYKFKVTFRWTGAHGHQLGTAVRYSPACFQPELRPDLLVAAIGVQPTAYPTLDTYAAQVRNRGASAAGLFEVRLADGTFVRTRTVKQLGPHAQTVVSFTGPACSALAAPTVTVDPTRQIDDFNRANNSLTATCPGS